MEKSKFEYKTEFVSFGSLNPGFSLKSVNNFWNDFMIILSKELNQHASNGWKLMQVTSEDFGIVCIWEREVTN